MDDILDRKLPFSLTAEQSLLGSLIIKPEAINEVADFIGAYDFYVSEHTHIYLALHELFSVNRQIDYITLIDTLVAKGIYDKAGGESYIRQLVSSVPTAMNVKDYAKIVKEKSMLRSLIEAGEEIVEAAFSQHENVESIVELAEQRIYAIAEGHDSKNFVHIEQLINAVYNNLADLAQNGIEARGVKTDFRDLDMTLGGIGNSDLVLIGARPGMGKTSFALNIATNVAANSGKKVCIFSLEMSGEQLVSRILSSEALIDSYLLRTGGLQYEDHRRLAEAVSRLAKLDILVDDTPGISVTAMKAKLRREKNLGLVIIDYLQLMQSDRHIDNRVQEVAEISRGLKIMAKELNVPVVCCAQLSRGPESRTVKKPMLSDLRDSGSIEQDADTVIFLYRDEYYKEQGTAGDAKDNAGNVAEAIIAKNRHGSTGTVKMGWMPQYTKFLPLTDKEPS